jgi:ubiquinone/menaquinone biosynthesis C-methylase UbiE
MLSAQPERGQRGGNVYDKYHSRSWTVQFLMRGFIGAVRRCLASAAPHSVLDVGCASGELAERLFWDHLSANHALNKMVQYQGIDCDPKQIDIAKTHFSHNGSFRAASVYAIPFPDASFDMVLACEVLEHLDVPSNALDEIARVSREWTLVSVPWEPIWRICNCARGAYLHEMGNTPGHIQHFTRRSIRKLSEVHFEIVEELHPFPWTILLLRKRGI